MLTAHSAAPCCRPHVHLSVHCSYSSRQRVDGARNSVKASRWLWHVLAVFTLMCAAFLGSSSSKSKHPCVGDTMRMGKVFSTAHSMSCKHIHVLHCLLGIVRIIVLQLWWGNYDGVSGLKLEYCYHPVATHKLKQLSVVGEDASKALADMSAELLAHECEMTEDLSKIMVPHSAPFSHFGAVLHVLHVQSLAAQPTLRSCAHTAPPIGS